MGAAEAEPYLPLDPPPPPRSVRTWAMHTTGTLVDRRLPDVHKS